MAGWAVRAEQRGRRWRKCQNRGLEGGLAAGNYLAFLVSDPPVELLPLQAQEVLPGLNDAALGRNGTGRVDVVPRHHADCNASALAFADSFRDLEGTRWLEPRAVPPSRSGGGGRDGLSALPRLGAWPAGSRVPPSPGASFPVLAPGTTDDSEPGPDTTSKAGRSHWNAVKGHRRSCVQQGDRRNHPALSTSVSTGEMETQSSRARTSPISRPAGRGHASELRKDKKGTSGPSCPASWQDPPRVVPSRALTQGRLWPCWPSSLTSVSLPLFFLK